MYKNIRQDAFFLNLMRLIRYKDGKEKFIAIRNELHLDK